MSRGTPLVAALMLGCAVATPPLHAQVIDPKAMSGSVLPVPDVPAGTITVRLVRGNFDKNITGHPVEFSVDGKKRTATTDTNGRAQVSGLTRGARVRAVAIVDGERLESQEAQVGDTGLRIILVATDPEAAKREEENRRLASAPPVRGIVTLGPESRVIAQLTDDRLDIFYLLQIVNEARTPVETGGPLIFELPRGARGARILEESSPMATANGPRVTVTGPFPPGTTLVQAAYELPYSGDTAQVTQQWPAPLVQVTILVQQIGNLTLRSSQATIQDFVDQGQRLWILGTGPGLPAGQSLAFEISGLPHRPLWPRNVALALAGVIVAAGFWGAFTGAPRRRAA